jgi:hypothetical protein
LKRIFTVIKQQRQRGDTITITERTTGESFEIEIDITAPKRRKKGSG